MARRIRKKKSAAGVQYKGFGGTSYHARSRASIQHTVHHRNRVLGKTNEGDVFYRTRYLLHYEAGANLDAGRGHGKPELDSDVRLPERQGDDGYVRHRSRRSEGALQWAPRFER